jgi:hypothetical protein
MSITTYAELQTHIANELIRTDLTTQIPTFIQFAEAEMSRKIKCREMEAFSALTMTGDEANLPADFRGLLNIEVSGQKTPLQSVSRNYIDGLPVKSGIPCFYSLQGTSILFYPSPQSSDIINIRYRRTIPALSDSNTSNWLLEKHPDAYQYGALHFAALYMHDPDKASYWGGLYVRIVNEINEEGIAELQAPVLQTSHGFNTLEGYQ